jgi:hypothetical protein
MPTGKILSRSQESITEKSPARRGQSVILESLLSKTDITDDTQYY